MSFEPIHDLTPGLDTNGVMMNPVFPVGNASGGDKNPWIQDSDIEVTLKTSSRAQIDAIIENVPEDAPPAGFPAGLL